MATSRLTSGQDVIKSRVQTQTSEQAALLSSGEQQAPLERRLGAIQIAKQTYRQDGPRGFFNGLVVCSIRAFIVNAVQFAVYEWLMTLFNQRSMHEKALGYPG